MTFKESHSPIQEEWWKKQQKNVQDNNLTSFGNALKHGADPNYSNGHTESIYEQILSTSNRAQFLKLCVKHKDYMPSKSEKAAINYAVQSLHFSNLLIYLLNDVNCLTKKIDVNHKYKLQTPLNYLAKELTKENANEVRECMELLLYKGAEVSISDKDNRVPLNYVVENETLPPNDKYELIYMLLRRYKSKDELEEAWKYIETQQKEKKLFGLERKSFDEMLSDSVEHKPGLTYNEKFSYLMILLKRSVKLDDKNVLFQTLNSNSSVENRLVLEKARDFKKVNLFKSLISNKHFWLDNEESIKLAKDIIQKMPTETKDKERYIECFKLLIESRHIDISGVDENGIPLLSYAATERNETAVKLLLNQGAYLGVRSNYKINHTSNIRPEILEEHFDSCITMDEESRKKNITISLRNICHPPKQMPITFAHNDMRCISRIKNSTDLQHLLNHPVVSFFLAHKWQLYSKFFYIHFVIYCLFLVLLTKHIICNFPNQNAETTTTSYICFPLLFIIIYLFARELVQIYIGWLHYVKLLFVNIIDISLIVFSTLTCLGVGTGENQNIFATFALLLSYWKLILLMSLLPIQFISMPLLMLIKVVKTVLKSSILFIVIAVFGLSFYIRLGDSQTSLTPNNSTNSTDSLNFNSFVLSFIKAIIMATGEYDASNMIFKSRFDILLLVAFVIIVGISLFNLLTAQAIDDIQFIKNQAKIIRAIDRVNFLNTSEEFLNRLGNISWSNRSILKWCKFLTKPVEGPIKKFTIRQYRYPYEITLWEYDYVPDKQNSTTIEIENQNQNEENRLLPDSETEDKPQPSLYLKRKIRYLYNIFYRFFISFFSYLKRKMLYLCHIFYRLFISFSSFLKRNILYLCHKFSKSESVTINEPHNASSQGKQPEFNKKFTMWLNKIFKSNIVDTKTVQRAVQIAEKNSNETSQTDTENYLKYIKDAIDKMGHLENKRRSTL